MRVQYVGRKMRMEAAKIKQSQIPYIKPIELYQTECFTVIVQNGTKKLHAATPRTPLRPSHSPASTITLSLLHKRGHIQI